MYEYLTYSVLLVKNAKQAVHSEMALSVNLMTTHSHTRPTDILGWRSRTGDAVNKSRDYTVCTWADHTKSAVVQLLACAVPSCKTALALGAV